MAKYQLRKRLTEDTEYYDKDTISKYADYLEEMGRLVWVENLAFDAEAMLTPFVCDTCQCIPDKNGKIGGRKHKSDSCCVVLTPRLSTDERKRLDEILPALCERFPDLAARIDRVGGFYDWDDGYDRMVRKGKEKLCVFMTPDTEMFGFHACQIHAWCLENDLSPELYKPAACVMFPVFLLDIDSDEGTMLISRHSRETSNVGEDEDNYVKVGCLGKASVGKVPMYITMRGTLEHMFNKTVWKALDKKIRTWCRENGHLEPPEVA